MFDEKRIFLSEIKNTNELDSIVSKVNIIKVSPNVSQFDYLVLLVFVREFPTRKSTF